MTELLLAVLPDGDAGGSILPHINASLNLLATVLLLAGIALIRSGRERAHRNVMLAAFAVSCGFLGCYLAHKAMHGDTPFPRDQYPAWAVPYYIMLASHVLLAVTVPFLATATIVLGLRDRRAAHKRLARITFPVWLYVSVTGVLVYLVLYWWCVPAPAAG
jgi:putative membrane protein